MDRRTYGEIMGALLDVAIAQGNENETHYCMVTKDRHILATSKEITIKDNSILIKTEYETIALPYSSIEYISL